MVKFKNILYTRLDYQIKQMIKELFFYEKRINLLTNHYDVSIMINSL